MLFEFYPNNTVKCPQNVWKFLDMPALIGYTYVAISQLASYYPLKLST